MSGICGAVMELVFRVPWMVFMVICPLCVTSVLICGAMFVDYGDLIRDFSGNGQCVGCAPL